MEQMYLIEIFVDKVSIFATEENENSSANKNVIIKVKFGPSVQFIIKEGQLAPNTANKDDIIEQDEQGRRKWSRTIRVGKSYLFPSYPDTVLLILKTFPLEIEVWNDDENEVEIFVGVGTMHWDTEFFFMLKETGNAKALHEPVAIKTITKLMAECCCKQVGEISFILRLSALGDSIITEFQQLMTDPERFAFRSNKAPSMFECKRIEGDNPNFCMVGSIYETATLEDPTIVDKAKQKLDICTELQSCGVTGQSTVPSCQHADGNEKPKKKFPVDKIRMGDITGPCGNSNCPLAHKVRNYIRALDTYKKEAAGKVSGTKDQDTNKICGGCSCKDDRYHREECHKQSTLAAAQAQGKSVCSGCGGVVHIGETCEDKKKQLFGTGATPQGSKTQVAYVFSVHHVPDFKESMLGRKFTIDNLAESYKTFPPEFSQESTSKSASCGCRKSRLVQPIFSDASCGPDDRPQWATYYTRSMGTNNAAVYNIEASSSHKQNQSTNHCLETPEDKDCKCDPPKPTPPCKTFDCDCIAEMGNISARKAHKPYCPSYKHKSNCPVTLTNEEEEKKEEDEDEAEPLPYGLPPIQLGPCPILGRPCSVPDGFARMYKNAIQPQPPPSYNDAGKVCCSKEYERIKKALKDYMKYEKEHDYRCINKFNVDTEKKCCDAQQRQFALLGRSCCGSHKLALQEKFKEEKK